MRVFFIIVNFLLFVIVPLLCGALLIINIAKLITTRKSNAKKHIKKILFLILIFLISIGLWVLVNYKKTEISADAIVELSSMNLIEAKTIYDTKCLNVNNSLEFFDDQVYIEMEKDMNSNYYNECLEKIKNNRFSFTELIFGESISNEGVIVNIKPSESAFRHDTNIFDVNFVNEIEVLKDGYIFIIVFPNTYNTDYVVERIVNYFN